jgi:hypothetical protein
MGHLPARLLHHVPLTILLATPQSNLTLGRFDAEQDHGAFGFGDNRIMIFAPLPFQAGLGSQKVVHHVPQSPQHHQDDDPKQRLLHHVCEYKRPDAPVKIEAAALDLGLLQFVNLDVLKTDFIPVVLQENVALDFGPKSGHQFELTLGNCFQDFRAAQFVLQHLGSIKPMFHMVPLDQHTREVPLACFLGGMFLGCQDIVKGRRHTFAAS